MKLKRVFWALLLISAVSLSSLCSAAALKYGDSGDGVKEIQDYLIAQNLLHTSADGVYGSATVKAIKNFQEALGLEVDGVCGALTYKILRAAAYNEIDVYNFRVGDYVPDYELPVASNDYALEVGSETEKESDSEDKENEFGIPNYSRVVYVEATAYSCAEPGLSAYTAMGTLCRRGVIATDPNVIPLGTRVYIPGYGYAVAEDTGGAIVGNVIDIAYDTVEECYSWGRRTVPMYILE